MSNKSKKGNSRSTSTIDLGTERKEKIEMFRAKKKLAGVNLPRIDDAVNILIDRGLAVEGLAVELGTL